MGIEYFDFGGEIASHESLDHAVQRVYRSCLDNPSCDVQEVRTDLERHSQSIIADFADGSFDAKNSVEICRVERLAITYSAASDFPWEVRALRRDFPITIHQNHVLEGEPRSLCLYIESWSTVERSWTTELFLKRIFWWLRETADGTLHKDDQPLEQLFFASPYEVILPAGFLNEEGTARKNLSFRLVEPEECKTATLIGKYGGSSENGLLCVPIIVTLDPMENGPVEGYPQTLGQLQDVAKNRGSGIIEPIKDAFFSLASDAGIEFKRDQKEFVLLLIVIPRSRNGEIERIDIQGFIVNSKVGELGESFSALLKMPGGNKWYKDTTITGSQSETWKAISITPVNVKCYPSSKEIRRYSGLGAADVGPKGIIAGVGALGGLLAKIWKRECWGNWSYIDEDILQAHNIVRHVASHDAVGYPKALVVNSIVNGIHSKNEKNNSKFYIDSILSDDLGVLNAIENAEVIIDVTTTLYVPRELSRRDSVPRTASVFITPSGMSSVLLLEDKDRSIRCKSLEAQYYRAILKSDWGAHHLTGHIGRLWVGAGCREITLEMSDELIHLHSAILARQIRKSIGSDNARICVWEYFDDLGELSPRNVPVFDSHSIQIDEWQVYWDDGFLVEIRELRQKGLPNETGGILFGIIDQKDKTISLVQACSAPENSESTPSSFGRAPYESTDILDSCQERTAGIVTYVGEWHSHPPGCAALPSQADIGQLHFLTASLQQEGMPALMLIIAGTSIGFYLEKQGKVLALV